MDNASMRNKSRIRLLYTALSVAAYVIVFFIMLKVNGHGMAISAVIPIIVIGWLYGLITGICAGLISFPINIILCQLSGIDWYTIMILGGSGISGTLALMLMGATVGRISDLTGRLNRELIERGVAEKKIKSSRDFLDNIFKTSPEIIMVVDAEGTIISVNDVTEHILGYTPQELIGKNMAVLTPDETDYKKHIYEMMGKLFEKGSVANFEFYVRRKDGGVCPVDCSAVIQRDDRGAMTGSVSFIRDKTSSKQAEEEKVKLEAQLQRAQKMESLGTLAGGVAHDLNNILSAMISYPELLLLDLAEDSPLRKPLMSIKTSGERAAAIVSDLLTLARRGVTVTEVVNLNTIITRYLESQEYKKLMDFHPAAEIELQLNQELLNIIGSPVHLSKTVMNLVSNAAEAMTAGGKMVISTDNSYLDRPVQGYESIAEGEYIVLTVADAGIGISQNDLQKIFEPFYTKKVMGRSGTGLGMSVVWGTVKDHRGYLDVKSVEGKGTTFTLYFPATRKDIKEKTETLELEQYYGNGERILIVDDVELQREIAATILKKINYSVETVASGEEAIAYVQAAPVDLVVLDMIMDPGIDGLETYQQLLRIHPGQKAIIVSGFSETDRVREAQRLGAGAYVKKPYALEQLGLAVKTALGK